MRSAVRSLRLLLAWVLGLVLLGTTATALGVAVYPQVSGGQALAVLSGSMEPSIPVSGMVFTRPVDPAEVTVGQVITFVRPGGNGELVTHRVTSVDTAGPELAFTTQGDANDVADLVPVAASAVVGTPRWVVPELGRQAAVLHSPRGLGALVLLVCAVVALAPPRRGHPDSSDPETVEPEPDTAKQPLRLV